MQLITWVEDLLEIVGKDLEATVTPGLPVEATRKALKELEKSRNPIAAIYALQLTIKESTEAFNTKWGTETSSV